MFTNLPKTPAERLTWDWPQFEPLARDLQQRPLTADSLDEWLQDWSDWNENLFELYSRLYVATTVDTADKAAEAAYTHSIEEIFPKLMQPSRVSSKSCSPAAWSRVGFETALRNMRAEAELFREDNLPLLAEEQKLSNEYDKIIGAQTVIWEGQERTVTQLRPVFQDSDRARREAAWRLGLERQLADREALNEIVGQVS